MTEARQITPERAVQIADKLAHRADGIYRTIMQRRQSKLEDSQTKKPSKRDWYRAERDIVTIRDSAAQLSFLLAGKDLDKEQPEFGTPPSAEYGSDQAKQVMPVDEEWEEAVRRDIEIGGEGIPFDWENVRAHQRLREASLHQQLRGLQQHVRAHGGGVGTIDLTEIDKKIEEILRYIRGEEG